MISFNLEVDPGGRALTEAEKQELARDVPRINIELKRRFGDVTCPDPECGTPESLTTVLELKDFPNIGFRFANICCDAFNRALLEAAKA